MMKKIQIFCWYNFLLAEVLKSWCRQAIFLPTEFSFPRYFSWKFEGVSRNLQEFSSEYFFFYPFVENSVKLSLVNFPTAISMYLYNSYEMSLNDVEKMDARRFLWSFCTGFQALWPSTKYPQCVEFIFDVVKSRKIYKRE